MIKRNKNTAVDRKDMVKDEYEVDWTDPRVSMFSSLREFEESVSERIQDLVADRDEAAKYVEGVICMRTGFTGQPPYVGWEGLGLALTEALDERDALKVENERLQESLSSCEYVDPMRIAQIIQGESGATEEWATRRAEDVIAYLRSL